MEEELKRVLQWLEFSRAELEKIKQLGREAIAKARLDELNKKNEPEDDSDKYIEINGVLYEKSH